MPKLQFGSPEWVQALQDELNKSPAYEDAARNWEGDFYFVVDPEGPVTEPVYLYMDLWHGKCRDAFEVTSGMERTPAFRLTAPVAAWKKVILKKLDPIQGMMTGQLKVRGNMAILLKNVRAAKELLACCTLIRTTFPD